ncbi:MAG: tetratricopeptide repeat protein [Proteobacteria bacterium]|nr:tetratricopeptide repeat protein [Pseudomonadota bacterium]
MKIKSVTLGMSTICLLGILAGCAGLPEPDADVYVAGSFNDKNLDVLFATEYPVRSEAEALAKGASAMQEGNIDKALFFFVRALQFNPENVDLLSHIGEIQMQRNNIVLAKRALLQARHYDPAHARTLEALGLIFMNEGKDERAVVELTMAVENDPGLWRAHNALGVYADKKADYAAAQAHYNAALSINPEAAHILNNRGYSKFLAGDSHGAALDLYEAANDRAFSQAWGNLGMIYAKQGWYQDAITTYKRIMSEANAYNNTGYAALQNGDLAQAHRFLNEAIKRSPTYFPAAVQNLARLKDLQ